MPETESIRLLGQWHRSQFIDDLGTVQNALANLSAEHLITTGRQNLTSALLDAGLKPKTIGRLNLVRMMVSKYPNKISKWPVKDGARPYVLMLWAKGKGRGKGLEIGFRQRPYKRTMRKDYLRKTGVV